MKIHSIKKKTYIFTNIKTVQRDIQPIEWIYIFFNNSWTTLWRSEHPKQQSDWNHLVNGTLHLSSCCMMVCFRGAVSICVQCTRPVPAQPPVGPPTVMCAMDLCHAFTGPVLCSPSTNRTWYSFTPASYNKLLNYINYSWNAD